jgi:two-component system invasion response regulator UvrY
MIRVAIVDDHPIVRRGLRDLLSEQADIDVVAEAGRPEEVAALLASHTCDVVLLDISLPGRGGLELLGDLLQEWPRLRVLIVSTHAESQYAVRAIKAGAGGYVLKSAAPEELVAAVRNVALTGRHITETVAVELAEYAWRRSPRTGLASLSNREYEVLRSIAAGQSTTEIAERLSLSVKTVSTYRARLLDKLQLKSVADLVRYAIEHGLRD